MKTYNIQQLATLAEVTVRTLHYYDKIGLLKPSRSAANSYRQYNEGDLLRLQQIMFFRELEFPLASIKDILDDQSFDVGKALVEHRKLIELKKKRMNSLLKTIDKTIKKIAHENTMQDNELYEGFSKEEQEAWNKEAKERWGDTDQYKQSVGKYESLTAEEKMQMQKDGEALMDEIVANMDKPVHSPEVQALVQRHYDSLKFFYEPNLTMYRGLADMYIGYQGDARFRAYFEKHHKDLPEFMRDAIYAYCDAHA
ncbi:MerR family transcriptional regulator [Patescibacteria group bacterium]|nr:MerR family transcriptional regulator [Patescibacteria group bacterium]